MENKVDNGNLNRAKIWQIGLFAFNNTATNCYFLLMMFVSYYATGVAGLGVVLVGNLLMLMRIWDGVTDPIIGFIVDKTNGKFGKNRPFMIIGNLVMACSVIIMFTITHKLPEMGRLPFFILIYAVYIIGYTLQCVVTKSAQTCLTNDPSQRPLFLIFDGSYNAILFTILTILISNVWVVKFGGFTIEFFYNLVVIVILLSALFTTLALVGIWKKDRTEFFGLGTINPVKIKLRDYWDVLKHNRAIQMLVISASTDKLFGNIQGNAIITVMLYGVICGNYGLSGKLGGITLIPTILFMFFGAGYIARKLGQKKALIYGTIGAMTFTILNFCLFLIFDPKTLSLEVLNIFTILFLLFTIITKGCAGVSGGIVIPMTADCADYETYRSGRYVPGLMGTLFSFIDKLISSLTTTIVALMIAVIGFTKSQPTIDTPYTTEIFIVTMICFFGLPLIGWTCNLISMKFYPLNKEKMAEIQTAIAEIKAKTQETA